MNKIAIIFGIIIGILLMYPAGETLPDTPLSETVLLSVNYPGDGFGTPAMCAGGEAYIYKDGTIHVWMLDIDLENYREIAVFNMVPAEYKKLEAFADVESIPRLKVRENRDVCDGNSYYITLYADGEPDFIPVLRKGGYMPKGNQFWKRYSGIKEILDEYGVRRVIDDWRITLEKIEREMYE